MHGKYLECPETKFLNLRMKGNHDSYGNESGKESRGNRKQEERWEGKKIGRKEGRTGKLFLFFWFLSPPSINQCLEVEVEVVDLESNLGDLWIPIQIVS